MSTDLSDLMDRATADVPVDTRRLVAGGAARGAAVVRRRRTRAAGCVVGVAALAVLAGSVLPGLSLGADTAREPAPAGEPTSLELVPTDELVRRFTEELPGTSTAVEAQASEASRTARVVRELTGADGSTGLVQLDAAVSAPYDAEGIAHTTSFCRRMHRKVGPLDGSDCVVVPGGIVQLWDDTVAPEDPAGNADGIRLAYAYYLRWDGGNVNVRSLNSTSADVPPVPGTPPVLRTAELVDLVQRLDVFTGR